MVNDSDIESALILIGQQANESEIRPGQIQQSLDRA